VRGKPGVLRRKPRCPPARLDPPQARNKRGASPLPRAAESDARRQRPLRLSLDPRDEVRRLSLPARRRRRRGAGSIRARASTGPTSSRRSSRRRASWRSAPPCSTARSSGWTRRATPTSPASSRRSATAGAGSPCSPSTRWRLRARI
jgi:hypothetical protein